MAGEAYVGTTKRSFSAAVFHLLENDYSVLGSRRILEMLAQDLEKLVDEFFPPMERVPPGWMVFIGTKAIPGKSQLFKEASDFELEALAWPVLVPADYPLLKEGALEKKSHLKRSEWFQDRLVRVIEHGLNQPSGPVLLTMADLACMFSLTTSEVSEYVRNARKATKKTLLTKGYYFDQGMKPTHKAEIVALFEQGYDEKVISQKTNHAPSSVGNYLRSYQRVKLLLAKKIPPSEISRLIDLPLSLVMAYIELIKEYHPHLFEDFIQ